ncbi:class I SAM-dependent methyltransferase [Sulfitobacter sp. MF3-043]|uniref:class I SAM-dependent methyltransferase n=1 Tax=Sulfitobacter sediminivivens TaxID=3252902 RepID=UPI0036DBD026
MTYDYEQLYRQTPAALGAPTQIFVDFFAAQSGKKLRVLDIGCGQGRDAIFIGRAGHSVVAVDLSPSGICDLNAVSNEENLDVLGIVADITEFEPEGLFDVVLIDRTLHMLAEPDRLKVLGGVLDHVDRPGWCLIADEKKNIPGFKRVVIGHDDQWEIVKEKRGYLFLQRPSR